MRSAILWLVVVCLSAVAAPGVIWAQYGGALHNGGWANGMGIPLPPRPGGPPAPIVLTLMPQTYYLAGGTNSFAVLFLNAPLSEARGRIQVIRVSDMVIIATSGWTGTLDNRVTISGLVVGTTYRVQVQLEALTPAWVSVSWTTIIASYVQPSKNDPPYEWEFQAY
jgi:hypothetical protein